jgi:uncharacterized protein YkwD
MVVLGLLPAAAPAAVRYVAPTGSTNDVTCDAAQPCEIYHAFAVAQEVSGSTDEVVIADGDYQLSEGSPITIFRPLTVHGAAGTRPRILGAANIAVNADGGSTLRDLEVRTTDAGAVAIRGLHTTLERVIAVATGAEATAMDLTDGAAVRSSVARSSDSSGAAIIASFAPTGIDLRHVTAVGGLNGIHIDGTNSNVVLTAVNSIVRGGTEDLDAVAGVSSTVDITVDHVAYRPTTNKANVTVHDLGGTVTGTPLFMAADNLRQAAGSPTLDAGRDDPNGPATALDGQARKLGPAPDIGADERAPDAVVPTATPTPEPVATATPEPAATPTPTPAPDFTLPGFLDATFRAPPVAGKPAELVIRAFDPDSPIVGVLIDLGPAGLFGETACRTFDLTGVFAPGAIVKFTVPVLFTAPGLQSYAVEIHSGGCDAGQVSRTEQSTQVQTGALMATAAAAPKCASTLVPSAGAEQRLADAVVCLVNKTRKSKRLKPLTVNLKLVASATAQTNDMIAKRYYNHQRPGGPTLLKRTRKAGYRGDSGENLGLGSGLLARPDQMLKAWLKSPPHRANILNRRFRAIGVNVQAKDPLGRMKGAAIYTINFGTRK